MFFTRLVRNLSGRKAAIVLAAGLAAAFSGSMAMAQSVYSEDFESGSAPGFTNGRVVSTPNGSGKILGRYGNESATLTLSGLIPGHIYRLNVDAFAIDSWDGNSTGAGPDIWRVTTSSGQQFQTTFSAFTGTSQAYPGEYPGGSFPGLTGGTACSCGIYCWGAGPTIYPVTMRFTASTTSETLTFSGSGLQDLCDESWGIDNLNVTDLGSTPDPVADQCSDATLLDFGGMLSVTARGSTLDATPDVLPVCAGVIGTGPGVWYKVLGTGTSMTASTCTFADFDTTMVVGCGDCGGFSCVGGNDDFCPGGGSSVTFCTQLGRPYYIWVGGYEGETGDFDLKLTRTLTACSNPVACSECTITIPAGAVAEGEPVCTDEYIDSFNGGCSSPTAAFSSLAVGQTIAGMAGTYRRGGQDMRDTDWYEFTLTSPARILIRGSAQFPLRMGLINGNTPCTGQEQFDLGTTLVPRCETGEIAATLAAGRYVLFVAPSALSGVPCSSPYYVTLTGEAAGACVIGSGCVVTTVADCASRTGTYQGDGTACSQVGYFVSTTSSPFEDISGSGTVAAVSDDTGVDIAIGFPFGFYDQVYTMVGISPNGYLTFGGDAGVPFPAPMGTAAAPNALVAARWSNLNPPANAVRYALRGSAPTRRLIVQWTSVPTFGLSDSNTFQAVLFEADGAVELRYGAVAAPRFGGEFTAGVESPDGTRGTPVPVNQVLSNTAISLRRGNLTPPVAVAGGPYVVSAAEPQVQLDATGSFDPDSSTGGFASIRSVRWEAGSLSASSATPTFALADLVSAGLRLGTQVPARLVVTDFDNLSAQDETSISYVNSAPVASAGGPYAVEFGGSVALAGSVLDPDLGLGVDEVITAEWDWRPATQASQIGDGFAVGLAPTVAYATLLDVVVNHGATIYLNVKDASGAVSSSATTVAPQAPNLVVESIDVTPAELNPTQSLTVSFVVRNAGGAPASGSWVDRVYLANEPGGCGGYAISAQIAGPASLAPGATYSRQMTVPTPAVTGTFRVSVRVDENGGIAELGGEADNCFTDDLPVRLTAPDLVVTGVTGPTDAYFGESFNMGFIVRNNAAAAALRWSDAVYLSADATLDASDRQLAVQAGPEGLAAAQVYSRSLSLTVGTDLGMVSGPYYLLVRTDSAAQQPETNEQNNVTASSAIRFAYRSYPDLRVTDVQGPPLAITGQSATIAFTVENQGEGEARGVWTDRVYLSTDQTLQVGVDFALTPAPQKAGPVANGQAYTVSGSYTMPAVDGTYYVLVRTDDGSTVDESTGESNNIGVSVGTLLLQPPPKADLVVDSVSAPELTQAGRSVVVEYSVSNIGNLAATGDWQESVYLSTNSTLDASDVQLRLAPANASPLAPGGTYSRSRSVTIPDTFTSPTDMHLIVKVDTGAVIEENNRLNNIRASGVVRVDPTPAPNLVATAQSGPASAVFGENITIGWSVRNAGNRSANGSWRDQVVLSRDRTLSSDDVPLGSLLVEGVSPFLPEQPAYTRSATYQIPLMGTSVAGEYFLVVRTDINAAVAESNETDNDAAWGPITVSRPPLPNLVAAITSTPADVTAGGTATVGYTIYNLGAAELPGATPWTLTIFEAADTQPGTRREAALNVPIALPIAAGSSITGTVEVPVAEFRSANVHFSACADTTNRIIESDEADNCAVASAASPYRRPDLEVTVLHAPSTAEAERSVQVSWTVRNRGNAAALPYWADSVYLAQTRTSTSLLLLANEAQTVRVEADGTYVKTVNVRIPDDMQGQYFFVVVTDTEDRVFEGAGGEGNNRLVAANATQITQPTRPNLIVESVAIPADGLSGTPMSIEYVVRNIGEAPATASWFERVFASRDRTLSADDVQLGSLLAARTLDVEEAYIQHATLRYPIPEGQWYLIVSADPTNILREQVDGGETDNITASQTPFAVTTFTATAFADIDDAPAGTRVRVSGVATVEGTGQIAAQVPVVVRVNVRGFERTFDALSDETGAFAVLFEPGPTEGGLYNVSAGPAHRYPPASDSFRLWSMRLYDNARASLFPEQSRTATLVLQNQGDVPIPGIVVSAGTVPAGISVEARYPNGATIPGLSTLAVEFLVQVAAGVEPGTYTIPLSVANSTPAANPAGELTVVVGAPRPELVATPTSLRADMLLGGQTFVQFKVRNAGGAPTGPLTVLLPSAPWLGLSTPRVMPSLASGEEATVVMILSPDRSVPLGEYPGGLTVSGTGVAASVQFVFKAVSDRRGDLAVTVTDEFTYWDEANGFPRVSNATVNVYDHQTGVLVASAQSDSQGEVFFDQLREGYYDVEMQSADHATARELKLVEGSAVNELLGFVTRQVVRYRWTVVPTEIRDEYRITIQAVFETNVPAPQIIIEPGYIDLRDQTLPAMVEYTVRNEGLITAKNVVVPSTAAGGYSLIPLVTNLGDLGGGQRVRVPVLVVPTGRGGNCTHVPLQVNWQLPCGPFLNGYSGSAYVYVGVCVGKPGTPPGPGGCYGCGWGPGGGPGGPGGPGGGGDPFITGPVIVQPVKCKPCTEKCVKSAIGCILDGDCIKAGWDCGNFVLNMSLGKFGKCIARGLKCAGKTVPKWLFPPSKLVCICKLIRDCAVQCVDGGPNFPCDPFEAVDQTISAIRGGRRDPPGDDPEYNYFKMQYERAATVMAAGWYMFGTEPFIRISETEEDVWDLWRVALGNAMDENSEAAETLSGDERAALLAMARPSNLTDQDLNTFFDRYNRTLTYYGLGIFDLTDVPQGWNSDFIERDIMQALYDQSVVAMQEVEAEGFEGLSEALAYSADVLLAKRNDESEGVCATVKIQIDQTLTLTRSAFNATLEIENGGGPGGDALDNIDVHIIVRDEEGNDITNAFGIREPALTNLNAVDGTGTLASGQTGSASWILIPTDEAAPTGPTRAFVGGEFSYTLNGQTVINPLFPVEITVLPNPNLQLSYFLEKEVFADDPFTPGIIEPSIPFSLGLLVKNTGAGIAKAVHIASSEPRIIENEKGLIIGFDIIGTQVGSEPVSPSLNVDLGDIAPLTGTNVARWLMTSTLQGEFRSYSATFEHVDPLNDPRLSLIESVDIFGLRHVVRTDEEGDDTLPDFLTDDRPDLRNLPDRVHLSDGSIQSVTALLDEQVTVSSGGLSATVRTLQSPSGYFYLRINDPFDGGYPLARVVRSDGKVIAADWNAWQTKRIKRPRGEAPEPQRYIHIFDLDGPGEYNLEFHPDGTPPRALSWRSLADHTGEPEVVDTLRGLGLELIGTTPTSEPRQTGLHHLVVQFNEAVRESSFTAANVTIEGKNLDGTQTDLSGIEVTAAVAADGTYGVIDFSPALPDRATYCIGLVGVRDLAGNFLQENARVRVSALIGDASGDQRTNNTDVGGVLPLLGTNPIDPQNLFHIRSDVNTDGRIDAADRAIVMAARGIDLRYISPACPTGRDGGSNPTDSRHVDAGPIMPAPAEVVAGGSGRQQAGDGVDLVAPLPMVAEPSDGRRGGDRAGRPDAPAATLAVYSEGSEQQLTLVLDELGMQGATIKPLPVDGWVALSLPARFADANAAAAVATMLGQRGLFASRLHEGQMGGASYATDGLIVSFKPGVPDSWVRKVLAMHVPPSASVVERLGGEEGVYLVHGGFGSGFEVEAAAKRLSQRADVAAAVADEVLIRLPGGDVQVQCADALLEVLAADEPAGSLVLIGDVGELGVAASYVPSVRGGDQSAVVEAQGLLAAMLAAAEQQGHAVHFVNVWARTQDGSIQVAQRSMVIEAMGWARDRDARVLLSGSPAPAR